MTNDRMKKTPRNMIKLLKRRLRDAWENLDNWTGENGVQTSVVCGDKHLQKEVMRARRESSEIPKKIASLQSQIGLG